MNLTGQQIKNTYEGVLNIGATGLTGTFQEITDGLGNNLGIQVSSSTINFTSPVTGLPVVDTSPITVQQVDSLVSTAIGATATVGGSIAIGATASVLSGESIAIGKCSRILVSSPESTVIGNNSISCGQSNVIVGNCSCAESIVGVAIGRQSRSGSFGGVAVGYNTRAIGDRSVAVGFEANTTFTSFGSAIAIGDRAAAVGQRSIAIGSTNMGLIANGCQSIALGHDARTETAAFNGIAIGSINCSESACSSILGSSSRIFPGATGTIVLGANSIGGTGACNSVVIGNSSQALTATSIVIGPGAKDKSTTGGTLNGAIVIGKNAFICEGNAYNGHIVIGNGARAFEQNSTVVIGDGAVGENIGVAIGCLASAAVISVALGGQASANGGGSIAIGRFANATQPDAQAYGRSSTACHVNSIALGPEITTIRTNTTHVNSLVAFGQAASIANTIGATSGSVTVDFDNSNVQTLTLGANITTLTKANPIDGGVYTLFLTQGGSGGYTVDFGDDVKFAGGVPPVLSTAIGATDAVSLVYIAGVTGYFGNANLNFA